MSSLGWRQVLCAMALALISAVAWAQDYPSRVVRIIVPFPAGGSTDTYARLIANELQAAWGRSVIVDNRAGGTGIIGSQAVRQAPRDGYTLLFTSSTAHVIGALLHDPVPFDPIDDYTPITMALRFPQYLIVHPAVPARTLKEFIAYGRMRAKQLNYASSGQGSLSHIAAEMLNSAAGMEAAHLPYKGSAPALQAVMAGEAHYRFDNIGISQPFVTAGKLRGLAVTGVARAPALPEVPTMAESGLQGFDSIYTWLGLFGPAQLPPAIADKLTSEVVRIMQTPEMRKRLLNDGYELVANTPAQFRSDLRAEVGVSQRLIREKGIKAE